jgi:hypothetical protein
MKSKLSLATVALAFCVTAMPGAASAHFDCKSWRRMDCMFAWMHRGLCPELWWHRNHRHH